MSDIYTKLLYKYIVNLFEGVCCHNLLKNNRVKSKKSLKFMNLTLDCCLGLDYYINIY